MTDTQPETKRYAHEFYPHPAEGTVRSLADDVPYLYARALGFQPGDDWFDAPEPAKSTRILLMVTAREIAFTADALHQGMTGDEAWTWAQARAAEESGEHVWERADLYGVPCDQIKPYRTAGANQ